MTDALKQACLVDLDNDIVHDDDHPSVSPNQTLQPDSLFPAALRQLRRGVNFFASWERMLDYLSIYNQETLPCTTIQYCQMRLLRRPKIT